MMRSLSDFQSHFVQALRGKEMQGFAPGADRGIPLDKRMDVYRNNVHASLIDALASAFPVVEKLVGTAFFRAMAKEFLREHLPRSRTLIGFGADLPDFVDQFPPVATLPYLGDVARLELTWLHSYHASNSISLSGVDFAGIGADEMVALSFDLHPSVQVLTSAFPVWSIWQANQDNGEDVKIDLQSGGEAVLMFRPQFAVELHRVEPDVIDFVMALAQRKTLGEAVEGVGDGFDLTRTLSLFLGGGFFSRVHRPSSEEQINV